MGYSSLHVALCLTCIFLQNTRDVTSQAVGGLGLSPSFSQADSASFRDSPVAQSQRCVLQCPQGYLPGTCLCQDNIFPFIFSSTPCRFTKCRHGEVCRMREGKAVCVLIFIDRPSIDVCNLHPQPGPCSLFMQRYFFDKTDGHCKAFTYGGCQGNGNSFATKAECEDTCIAHVPHSNLHHSNTPQSAVVLSGSSAVSVPSSGGSGSQDQPAAPSSRQIETCQLPMSRGPCFAHFPSYFFNSQSGQCETFTYGGCGGNENRFQTREECERACRGSSKGALSQSQSTGSASGSQSAAQFPSEDVECNLPKAPGLCRAYIPSFHYNTQTGQCESFVYGGCQGNANRFESKAQCEQKCKSGNVNPSPSLHSDCLQPKKVGRCRARIQRWYFDQDSLSCRVFYYGGCAGNQNNFRSKTACERRCIPQPEIAASSASAAVVSSGVVQISPSPSSPRPSRCSLPKVTGPCRASMRSFYFNTASQRCELFIYGGCSGNDNRFETQQECETTCSAGSQPQHQHGINTAGVEQPVQGSVSIQPLHENHNVCLQPQLPGPCHASMPRFFYNRRSGQCQHFIYRGCGGNGNNFRSYSACVRQCVHTDGGRPLR